MERLTYLGLDNISEIRAMSADALERAVGRGFGEFLYRSVRGIDPGIFADEPKSRSMSGETTYEHDVTDVEALKATILEQSQELMFRLIEGGVVSRTVHLKLRYSDFETISAQETLDRRIVSADDIRAAALSLLQRKWEAGRAVRLIGVGVAALKDTGGDQNELFPDPSERVAAVERAVFALKKGKGATVTKARLLPRTEKKTGR
jgi:DNA polymerase-4